MCLFSLQLGISTGMVDANIKSGHLQSFHWGHWGQDGSDKKQRQPQSCHEALAAVQLHGRHVNWLEDSWAKIADAGRCQRTMLWWNLPVLTNQQILPFGFKFYVWYFFPLTCHLCFVMVLDTAWCHGAVNPVRLRQLTNSVRTVGRSGLPVVCAQSWWVEPMLSSQRLQKVGLNCLSGNRIRDDSSARLAQHGFPQWDVHNWDRINMIPVVPHKAAAEVSKIGNL